MNIWIFMPVIGGIIGSIIGSIAHKRYKDRHKK